jgi:phosphatidylglycerophosphatase A
MPFTVVNCVAGFALFRLFDIVKPPPVRQLDRDVGGGWGIVLDDIAAGILANVVLRVGWWVAS